MTTKPRRLADLSDDEIEAERKRRRAANRPKRVRVFEMDEDTFQKHFGSQDSGGDDDEEDDDEDKGDEGEDEGAAGYFRKSS